MVAVQTVEVVLTAHPTQVMRRSLQHKQCRIGQLLQELERVSANSTSSDELLRALFREVMATWQTDELRRTKPTPVEEAKGARDSSHAQQHLVSRFLHSHAARRAAARPLWIVAHA